MWLLFYDLCRNLKFFQKKLCVSISKDTKIITVFQFSRQPKSQKTIIKVELFFGA